MNGGTLLMILIHEITMRLIAGEPEIVFRMSDERTAINLEDSLRAHFDKLGISGRFPHLRVSLGPESVTVSTRPRVENNQS